MQQRLEMKWTTRYQLIIEKPNLDEEDELRAGFAQRSIDRLGQEGSPGTGLTARCTQN